MLKYDAIVIGAGQAGGPLAKKLALAGKKTLLVEKRWIGGTCVNDGCTPTKTWVASAKMAYLAAHSSPLGVKIKDFSVNMPKIKKRKDEVVHQFRNGSLKGLEATKGLNVLFGEATFTGDKIISVKPKGGGRKKEFGAELIFINTGAQTIIPEIEGLKDISYLTSTSILELETVPEHLLILGGNYIGLEFGQMFRRFGSKVTILEKSPRIVSREDEDVSDELDKLLKAEGITIYSNTVTTAFSQKGSGKILVAIKTGDKEEKIKCTHVLVAVGRSPQTGHLNLQATGVETDERGYIKVDDKLETNVKGIYALGDVKGGPAFTHISYNDYTIVYRNIVQGENLSTNGRFPIACSPIRSLGA
jgi:pyruvate/2-oxoglutarate dehydrogenase complex dihydrolipoamide dehydrogenase (E3) component